jgi:hypothetical protein
MAEGCKPTQHRYAGMMSPHPMVAELADALRELEAQLRKYGAPDWAGQVGRCAELIEMSDDRGAERYRGLAGGMGSLNDLILHRDGDWLTTENNRLQTLLSRTSSLARALRERVDSGHAVLSIPANDTGPRDAAKAEAEVRRASCPSAFLDRTQQR